MIKMKERSNQHNERQDEQMSESKKQFHCKDVGYDCDWRLEGNSEDQMLPIIEKHAAEVHNLTEFKAEAVQNVRDAIRQNDGTQAAT